MIKAIIFDCFGVLAEDAWMPFKRKYVGDNQELADQIAELGRQNEFGVFDNETMIRKVSSLLKLDPKLFREVSNRKVPNTELFDFIRTKLKPKFKIGMLSNANYDVVHELFEPHQTELFDASVMSYESKLIKPDSAMYKLMATRLKLENKDCIFIDDQERYCLAAENYGMKSIWYKSVEQCKQEILQLTSGS